MAEAKRRLPLWMLKQKTETKALKSDANLKSEDKSEDQIRGQHVERKERKRVLEEKSEEQIERPVKRKQRRKTSNQDPDEFDETDVASQRCRVRQRNSRTRRKDDSEIGEGSTEGVKIKRAQKKVLAISDDEIDLTIDDLVSIAEVVILEIFLKASDITSEKSPRKYVNADRDELKKSTVSATSENHPSKDSSKPMLGSRLSKGLLKCSNSKTSTVSSDYALSDNNNLKDDTNIPLEVAKTGDPAQDMLDLFLGPLLKKPPPVKEPLIEPV